MKKTDELWLVMFAIGVIIGVLIAIFAVQSFGTEAVDTTVLDAACARIHGEGYHWTEHDMGAEQDLACIKGSPCEEKPLLLIDETKRGCS